MPANVPAEAAPEVPPGERVRIPEFPVFRTREELSEYLEGVDYDLDRLRTLDDSVENREKLVKSLLERDPHLDGNAEALVEHLRLNHQELERKESWLTRFAKMPGRALGYTWETIKAHPYITTAVVLALTAAALYYTGAGSTAYGWIKGKIMGSLLGEGVAGAAETAGEAAEVVGEAAGAAGEAAAEAAGEAAGAAEGALEAAGEMVGGAAEAAGEADTLTEMLEVITETAPEVPGSEAEIGEIFKQLGNR